MTTEEKAIAYDETLEKARSLYEQAKKDGNPIWATYEYLFPQLRESEDEKMMRVIGLALTDVPEGRFTSLGTTLKDCLAYLEKQKDAFENGRQLGIMQEQARQELEWTGEKQKEQSTYKSSKSEIDFANRYSKDVWEKLMSKFKEVEGYSIGCNDVSDIVLNAILNAFKWQKEQNEIIIEQVYKEFINPEKLKDAKTNKYIRAQLLWELMHNGIITEVDYQYLTDDKRKPWTAEEYRIAYQKGFDMSEQLKQQEQKPVVSLDTMLSKDPHLPKQEVKYEQKPVESTPLTTLLSNYLKNDFEYFATKKWDEKKWNEVMNNQASELLRIAKKELEKEKKPTECIEFDNEFKNQVSHLLASVLNKEWEYDKEFVEYAAQQLLGYAKHEIQPAEWSEEDEEKINSISEIIEHCVIIPYSGGKLTVSKEYKKELQCFLKSLRPSWKPSKEQMEAFRGYIEDFQARAEAAVGGWNNFDVMIRLYEQLKKL